MTGDVVPLLLLEKVIRDETLTIAIVTGTEVLVDTRLLETGVMIVTEVMVIVIEVMVIVTVTDMVIVTGIEAMEAVHGIVCRRLQRRDLSLPWHLGVRQRRMMTA